MNNCPECSAKLRDKHVDERSTTPVIYGGQTIKRVLSTRFEFSCGCVVFQNEHYL